MWFKSKQNKEIERDFEGSINVLVNLPDMNDHPLMVIEVTANTEKTAFLDIAKDILLALERAKRKVSKVNKKRNHGWGGVHYKSYATHDIVNSEVLRTITDTTKYNILAFGYGNELAKKYKEIIDFEFHVSAPCIHVSVLRMGTSLNKFESGWLHSIDLQKGKVIYPKDKFKLRG